MDRLTGKTEQGIRRFCGDEGKSNYIHSLLIMEDIANDFKDDPLSTHLCQPAVKSMLLEDMRFIEFLYQSRKIQMPTWFQDYLRVRSWSDGYKHMFEWKPTVTPNPGYLATQLALHKVPWNTEQGIRLLDLIDGERIKVCGIGIRTAADCAKILSSYDQITKEFSALCLEVPKWFSEIYEPEKAGSSPRGSKGFFQLSVCQFCSASKELMTSLICKRCYIKRKDEHYEEASEGSSQCWYIYQYNGGKHKIGDRCTRLSMPEKAFCTHCVNKKIL